MTQQPLHPEDATVRITVRLPERYADDLRAFAEFTKTTVSDVVRDALATKLEWDTMGATDGDT